MRPARQTGLTLIEALVVVVIIGVLSGFALQRLLPLIGKAETVSFSIVVNQLNNALLMETAKRIASGRGNGVTALANSNPMDLMLRPPDSYLGELPQRPEQPPRRSWYFDTRNETLVYTVGNSTRFLHGDQPLKRIEFQVAVVYEDRDFSNSYTPRRDEFGGVWLRPELDYRFAD